MADAFRRLKSRALRETGTQRRRKKAARKTTDWKTLRTQNFMRAYRTALEVRGTCPRCHGPASESMQFCPWCGTKRRIAAEESRFRGRCPRCKRSMKTDWRFCPHCFGPAVHPDATPRHSDRRYSARCSHAGCGGYLMPFMRYCPWCRRKVRRVWKFEGHERQMPALRLERAAGLLGLLPLVFPLADAEMTGPASLGSFVGRGRPGRGPDGPPGAPESRRTHP